MSQGLGSGSGPEVFLIWPGILQISYKVLDTRRAKNRNSLKSDIQFGKIIVYLPIAEVGADLTGRSWRGDFIEDRDNSPRSCDLS